MHCLDVGCLWRSCRCDSNITESWSESEWQKKICDLVLPFLMFCDWFFQTLCSSVWCVGWKLFVMFLVLFFAKDANTALMIAAERGHVGVLQLLLKAGRATVNDKSKQLPLYSDHLVLFCAVGFPYYSFCHPWLRLRIIPLPWCWQQLKAIWRLFNCYFLLEQMWMTAPRMFVFSICFTLTFLFVCFVQMHQRQVCVLIAYIVCVCSFAGKVCIDVGMWKSGSIHCNVADFRWSKGKCFFFATIILVFKIVM